MKTILSTTIFLVALLSFGLQIGYTQINRQVNTKKISNSKISSLTEPLPVKKIRQRDFRSKLVKDVSKVARKRMRVAATYFNKRSQRNWKITPERAFGSGSLGFTMYSGQLWRQYFFIEGHLRGDEPVAYSGHITFDARQGKTYLIKFFNDGANGNVYINAEAGNTPFKTHGQNGCYPILIQANESGEMLVAISARYRVGQNERYPEPLLIKEITIDEI